MQKKIVQKARRRFKAEINVVPYIDVMLVLLVIFMVVAPMSPVGTIDVPRSEQSNVPPTEYVELGVSQKDGKKQFSLVILLDEKREELGIFQTLEAALNQLQSVMSSKPQIAVLIAAQRDLKYEEVVTAMSAVKKMGALRVGLATQ